jgi:tetratricopeptide (TPR) repeat protein
MRIGRILLAASAVAALSILGWQMRSASHVVVARTLTEEEVRASDIVFYEKRVQSDPSGSLNMAQLAGLYLQRARETANPQDLERAEEWARRSLAASAHRNGKAKFVLASSLMGQHRFAEALVEARELVSAQPEEPSYRAILGELQLETGAREEAQSTFEELEREGASGDLSIAARIARWHEVEGRTGAALQVLAAARDEAHFRGDLPSEQVAWFSLRIGDLLLQRGELDAARKSYTSGLKIRPNDHR